MVELEHTPPNNREEVISWVFQQIFPSMPLKAESCQCVVNTFAFYRIEYWPGVIPNLALKAFVKWL